MACGANSKLWRRRVRYARRIYRCDPPGPAQRHRGLRYLCERPEAGCPDLKKVQSFTRPPKASTSGSNQAQRRLIAAWFCRILPMALRARRPISELWSLAKPRRTMDHDHSADGSSGALRALSLLPQASSRSNQVFSCTIIPSGSRNLRPSFATSGFRPSFSNFAPASLGLKFGIPKASDRLRALFRSPPLFEKRSSEFSRGESSRWERLSSSSFKNFLIKLCGTLSTSGPQSYMIDANHLQIRSAWCGVGANRYEASQRRRQLTPVQLTTFEIGHHLLDDLLHSFLLYPAVFLSLGSRF